MACVLPPSLVAAAWMFYDYQHGREQLAVESIGRARAIVSAVDRELAGVQGALAALATSPHLASGEFSLFRSQAAEVGRGLAAFNVVLIDPAFRQRVNTSLPQDAALPLSVNPELRAVFATGKPVTTDIFVGPTVKKPLIAIAIPVYQREQVAYVLAAGIAPERLADLLRGQRLEPGWIGGIFDSAGTVVARTHQMERFVGTKAAPGLLERMRQVPEGHLEVSSLEGIRVMSAFSRSAVSRWTVAIGIPSRELEAALWRRLGWLVACIVAAGIGALLLAWRIAGSIAEPILHLTRMAERIGEGRPLGAERPLALREADDVARSLRAAVGKIASAEHRAHHDPLTGLPNRALFNEIVAREIAVCRRDGSAFGVLFIDLDGFKRVNDELGHAAGDDLLRVVAARLRDSLRGSDLAARLGGDEFGVLLRGAALPAASHVAEKVVALLSAPCDLPAGRVSVSASIGVAVSADGGESADALLARADHAMYRVKQAGKSGFAVA